LVLAVAHGWVVAVLVYAVAVLRPWLERRWLVKSDRHAEIDRDLADCVAEVLERIVGIATGIADDDEAAAPPHHFVKTEILEMAAVGDVDIGARVGGETERLVHQRHDGGRRPLVPERRCALRPRIAEPPSEADIEDGHEEGDRRRGVVAHVRIGGGAGNRHSGAERDAVTVAILFAWPVRTAGPVRCL